VGGVLVGEGGGGGGKKKGSRMKIDIFPSSNKKKEKYPGKEPEKKREGTWVEH